MRFGQNTKYSLLPDAQRADRYPVFSYDWALTADRQAKETQWTGWLFWWLVKLLGLIGVAGTFFWLGMSHAQRPGNLIRHTSVYSPGLKAVSESLRKVRFNGGFGHSPYRGPPSPDVDAAWSRVTKMGAIRISDDEFKGLNVTKHAVKLPDALGGGYMAMPAYVHQLHCVYILWKNTYPDYYHEEYDALHSDPNEFHEHMDHCAEMLRQKLMCDADMGIIPFNWLRNHLRPHPNFATEAQCRDFDAALQWGLDREIDASPLGRDYWYKPDGELGFTGGPPSDPQADP